MTGRILQGIGSFFVIGGRGNDLLGATRNEALVAFPIHFLRSHRISLSCPAKCPSKAAVKDN